MSDALNYLLKVRPDAMRGYFGFLKEAGRHLDPKTRALLSVVTKVASQTDAGFRQYLSRALRDGCTPEDILDALLMAFPVLGLTKIVWAVDILLGMDIPEFRPESFDHVPRWHEVLAVDSAPVGETTYVDCDGRSLFVRRSAETLAVYDSRCPHQVTNIPKLALEAGRLTCPKHGWVFDIETGRCLEKGDRPLREFASKMEEGQILAYW